MEGSKAFRTGKLFIILAAALWIIPQTAAYIVLRQEWLLSKVRTVLTRDLAASYGLELSFDGLKAGPGLGIQASNLKVRDLRQRAKPVVARLNHVYVRFSVFKLLFHAAHPEAALTEVLLDRPRLAIAQGDDGSWFWERFMQAPAGRVYLRPTIRLHAAELHLADSPLPHPVGRHLAISNGVLNLGAYPRLRGWAYVRTDLDPSLRLQVRGDYNLDRAGGWVRLGWSGASPARWQRSGWLPDGRFLCLGGELQGEARVVLGSGGGLQEASAALSRGSLKIKGTAWPVLSVSGRADLRRRTLRVSGLDVAAGSGRLSGSGRVDLNRSDPRIEADLNLSELSLSLVSRLLGLSERAVVKGNAQGRLKVTGRLSQPNMSGDLRLSGGLSFPPFPAIDRIRLDGRFAAQAFVIESLRADMGPARLNGSGTLQILPIPQLELDLSARRVALADLLASLGQPGWRGSADLEGRLEAFSGRWTLTAAMAWRGAFWHNRSLPDGRGRCSLSGGGDGLELQGEGRIGDGLLRGDGRLREGRWQGEARLTRIGLAPLAALLPKGLQDVAGTATADLIWRDRGGTGTNEASFAGRIEGLVLAGRRIDMFQGNLSWRGTEIAVPTAQIKLGSASASCQGRFDWSRNVLWLQAAVHRLPLALLSPDLPGRAEGRLDVSGRWPDVLSGEGWLHVNGLAWHGMDLGVVRTEFDLQGDQLIIERGRLESPDGQFDLSGRVSLTGERPLACKITNLKWSAAAWNDLLPGGADLQGRLTGGADLSGTLAAPEAAVSIDMGPGQVYDLEWQRIGVEFRWRDGLILERGTVQAFGTELLFTGTLGSRWNLSVRVAQADLAAAVTALPYDLPWTLGGRMTLTGRISGPLAQPLLTGDAVITGFTLGDLECSHVAGKFRLDDRRLFLSDLEARAGDQSYSAAGEIDLKGRRLALEARVARGDLAALLGLTPSRLSVPLRGLVSGWGRIEGPLDRPGVEAVMRVEEGAIGQIPYEGEAEFSYANQSLTWRGLRMTYAGGGLEAAGRLSGTELRLDMKATGLPLAELAALAGIKEMVTGRGDLRLTLDRTGRSMRGDFRLDVGQGASLAGIPLDHATAAGSIKDRNIVLSQAGLASGGYSLSVLGRFPLPEGLGPLEGFLSGVPAGQDRIGLRIEGAGVPVALLNPALQGSVTFTGGYIDVAAKLSGTWTKPVMEGSLGIREAKGKSALLPDPFSSLNVQARLAGQKLLFERAGVRLGSGWANAVGSVILSGSGPQYDLRITGGRIAYKNPTFIDGQASNLDLTVKGGPIPLVEGAINVTETRITVGPSIPGPPPPPIALNVRLKAGKNVRFALPGVMDIPLTGEVQLRGTLIKPTLSGLVSANRGWVLVYGERFDVTMAVGNFTHDRGYLPYIELHGQKALRGVRVFVKAHGEVAESGLTIVLWSEPPLSQQEILSLLQPIAPGAQDGGRLNGGLEFFVETVFGQITEDVRRMLSADQLQLTLDDQSGAFSLQMGKYIRDDLYVSYEILFDEFSTRIWSFDYQLNPFLVLGGTFSTTEDPKWTLSYQIKF